MIYSSLIFLVPLVFSVQAITKEDKRRIQADCKEVTKVQDEELMFSRQTGFIMDAESLGPYAKCIAVKIGLIAENGDIRKDVVTKYFKDVGINDETIEAAFERCDGPDKPEDVNFLAVHYNNCFGSYLPVESRILVEE